MAAIERGPYLNAAVFCDEAVVGQDGALSLIRIIDTVNVTAEGPDAPDQMLPFLFRTKLVITLKAGEARGRFKLKMRAEAPDGSAFPVQEEWIQLDGGGHTGLNIVSQIQLGIELEGLYWFDVIFEAAPGEDRLLTRIPLRILYLPRRTPASS